MLGSILKIFTLLLVLSLTSSVYAQNGAGTWPKSALIEATELLEDLRILSADSMQGREASRAGMQKARDYIKRRFHESGILPLGSTYEQEFRIVQRDKTETLKGVNFIGFIKGAKRPDKYIVITAHYDHLGVRKGKIYNGADDNASGTASLFAIAKAINKEKLENSVIFIAFDAEETASQGSKYFVANLPVKKESIGLNINVDMVSRNTKGELWVAGAYANPFLRPTLEEAQKVARVKLMIGHDDPKEGREYDWTFQSDQESFHAAKIPWIYFGVEDHKDYHKPTDDFVNIMPEFYVHAVETVLLTARLFDKELSVE